MFSFHFYQNVKILYGVGAVEQLGELIASLEKKKALIVCDPGMQQMGITDRIREILAKSHIDCVIFDENEPNPPIVASEKAFDLFRKAGCDLVVGLGGGSNIDCAKGVNILRFNEPPLMQYANFNKSFDVGDGLILIPTTAGTGSELSDGAILSDEHHIKYNFIADRAFAEYAIVDPQLTAGMPETLTATTGLDALAHAIEAYTSTLASDYSDFLAEKVIDEICTFLPQAIADGSNMEARRKLAMASNIAGYLLVCAHTNAGHSIGQTLGGYFNIPHGMACAYAEPWVMEFNAVAWPDKIKRIGVALGVAYTGQETPEEIGAAVRTAFITFRDELCRLPSIEQFHCDPKLFEEVAEVCAKEFFQQFNPRTMTKDDCLELLKKL